MVVCNGIERAIQYFHAFKEYLAERKSPYQAIVAFSGEHEYGGANATESSLNGFSSNGCVPLPVTDFGQVLAVLVLQVIQGEMAQAR